MRNTSSVDFPYRVQRTRGQRLLVRVQRPGVAVVYAPPHVTQAQILGMLSEHAGEIRGLLSQFRANLPDEDTSRLLRRKAQEVFPAKLAFYAQIMGVWPTGLRIGSGQRRHGSCDSHGKITLSWRILAYPEEYVDYVVVHELAHLKHMDHSPAFWKTVEEILPDYRKRRRLRPTDCPESGGSEE